MGRELTTQISTPRYNSRYVRSPSLCFGPLFADPREMFDYVYQHVRFSRRLSQKYFHAATSFAQKVRDSAPVLIRRTLPGPRGDFEWSIRVRMMST